MTLKPKSLKSAAGLLLLAGTLAAADQTVVSTVHAASKTAQTTKVSAPPARPGLMGTIISSSGKTLKISLVPSHKSATVNVTAKTQYLINGKSTAKQPTWKKGEQIAVSGTKTKTGTYTATTIMVGGPGGPGGPGGLGGPGGPGGPPAGGTPPVTGKVVSATTSALVVKTSKGTTTFKLTSSTRYLVNGKASSKRPALKVGEQVHISGSGSGNTQTARTVIIGAMPAPPSGSAPPGQ